MFVSDRLNNSAILTRSLTVQLLLQSGRSAAYHNFSGDLMMSLRFLLPKDQKIKFFDKNNLSVKYDDELTVTLLR